MDTNGNLFKDTHRIIISIDFDGTIVQLNEDVHSKNFVLLPYAKEVINWIYDNFHTILWTCRSGQVLQNALDFLNANDIKIHTINENAPFLSFNTSRKIYYDHLFDDKVCNIDWLAIQKKLYDKYILSSLEDRLIQAFNDIFAIKD